jgi:PAS domain S-box-containing protein
VESSDDAIVGTDLQGSITDWNRGATAIYGYSPEETVGRQISLLKPSTGPAELAEILVRLKRGELIPPRQSRHIKSDGSEIDVALTVSPVHDPSGQVIGLSMVGRDVTEQLLLREKAEKGLLQEIELTAIQRTVGTYAHELNNPLTGVLSLIQMLRDQATIDMDNGLKIPDDVIEMMREIEGEAQRMRRVLKQLEDLTRPTYKDYIGGRQIIDLGSLKAESKG